MIIAENLGGLGNQLFQYANAKALSLKLGHDLYFDLNFFETYHRDDVYRLDKFKTSVKIADEKDINMLKRKNKKGKIYRKVSTKLGFSSYSKRKFHFDNQRMDRTELQDIKKYKDIFISGYYADQKYFIDIEDVIRKEFTIKEPLNVVNQRMLNKIENSEAVSLHIRRGDYVGNSFFARIPITYYENAINYVESKTEKNNTYFIFSDDIEWSRNNLKTEKTCVFVDINESSTDYMELTLMAACKHNIIANSTFSWWGAWLNDNMNKIVIAPKIWFGNLKEQNKYNSGNLVPEKWIKL